MLQRVLLVVFTVTCLVNAHNHTQSFNRRPPSNDTQWMPQVTSLNLTEPAVTSTSGLPLVTTAIVNNGSVSVNSTMLLNISASGDTSRAEVGMDAVGSQGFLDRSGFLHWLSNIFDTRTLILIVAFGGLILLIGGLIAILYCICNGLESFSSKDSKNGNTASSDLATNPAYDTVKYQPNYNSDDFENFGRLDADMQPSVDIPLIDKSTLSPKPKNGHDLLNLTSSMSCSSVSMNSVIFNKTPGSVEIVKETNPGMSVCAPATPSMPASVTNTPSKTANLRSSISNLVNNKFSSTPSKISKKNDDKSNASESERSCLLDEMDSTVVPNNDSIVRKFQPQSKTGQQILHEQKISKHPSYSRTQSEVNSTDNNRLSAASSRSSILMPNIPLSFDQIKDDIDDLAVHKEKLASRTNLNNSSSLQNSQIIDADAKTGSVNTSIADIYIQELISKHQESSQKNVKKKLTKIDVSASTGSILSAMTREAKKNKRLSMNVDVSKVNFNTEGSPSTTNLDKNFSASNYTMGSEKSCY